MVSITVGKLKALAIAALTLGAFVCSQSRVDSVATVTLSGSAGNWALISAGQPGSLTSAPGISNGSSTFVPLETADPFTDTINFGTLTDGNGTLSSAQINFRQRGNQPIHVSCSVSAFTANNISYNGTTLASGNGSQMSFVRLGSAPAVAGPRGDASGMTYGSRWTSGTDTLATLNGGAIAAVTGSHEKFVSFTTKPSLNGSANSNNNWVQNTAIFRVPTGLIWGTTGAAPNNWSISVQFGVYAGP